jgi:hypothetical protein
MLRAVTTDITLTGWRKKERSEYVEPRAPAPTRAAAAKRRSRARQNGADEPVARPSEAPEVIEQGAVALDDDLAAVVVRKSLDRLASGELQPNLRDGLIAQQLIDRREEKAADRQFMLSLARALAGGGYEAPSRLLPASVEPPEEVVEGYFEEVPLAPAHLRSE